MKTQLKLHLLLLTLLSLPGFAQAQGTAFGYQGRLNEAGLPATGLYDFTFTVFDTEAGPSFIGPTLVQDAVPVTNGLFHVRLDFSGIFPGTPRWLEMTVRTNGVGVPKVLTPRTELLPTPYAISAGRARSVDDAVLTVDHFDTGGSAGPTPGQFLSYNGANLFWSDPAVAAGDIFSRLGTVAYYNAGNVGIGTSTPAHRLSLSGGPRWTENFWLGAVELPNGAALGWQQNSAGQRFGMGHSDTGFYLFRTASDPGTTDSPSIFDVVVNDVGHVGIGTTTPSSRLQVHGDWDGEQGALQLSGHRPTLRFTGNADSGDESWLLHLGGNGPGNLGFFRRTAPSAWSPVVAFTTSGRQMEIYGQDALGLIGYQPFLTFFDSDAGNAASRIQCVGGEIVLQPKSYIDGSNPNAAVVIANSGNVSVASLTIRGGADVAEPFELTTVDIAKGSVVVIDDEHAGKLKLSTRAYDTRVAGIVSGANGIQPGISLHQQGALEGGQNVALSGRVYVLADASSGAIKPGDLLTTSGTPGHAMKVADHARASGAILGKAMSALEEDKGMVLVLVTLQ